MRLATPACKQGKQTAPLGSCFAGSASWPRVFFGSSWSSDFLQKSSYRAWTLHLRLGSWVRGGGYANWEGMLFVAPFK